MKKKKGGGGGDREIKEVDRHKKERTDKEVKSEEILVARKRY